MFNESQFNINPADPKCFSPQRANGDNVCLVRPTAAGIVKRFVDEADFARPGQRGDLRPIPRRPGQLLPHARSAPWGPPTLPADRAGGRYELMYRPAGTARRGGQHAGRVHRAVSTPPAQTVNRHWYDTNYTECGRRRDRGRWPAGWTTASPPGRDRPRTGSWLRSTSIQQHRPSAADQAGGLPRRCTASGRAWPRWAVQRQALQPGESRAPDAAGRATARVAERGPVRDWWITSATAQAAPWPTQAAGRAGRSGGCTRCGRATWPAIGASPARGSPAPGRTALGRPGRHQRDGSCNGDDFVALAVNYTGTGGSGGQWATGDFDGDGDVDGDDFVALAVHYTGTLGASGASSANSAAAPSAAPSEADASPSVGTSGSPSAAPAMLAEAAAENVALAPATVG